MNTNRLVVHENALQWLEILVLADGAQQSFVRARDSGENLISAHTPKCAKKPTIPGKDQESEHH